MNGENDRSANAGLIRLGPEDAGRFLAIRRRMLTAAPWAFDLELSADPQLALSDVRKLLESEHASVFGVPDGSAPTQSVADESRLVAVAGITRAEAVRYAHRARLWGIFVEPTHRRAGHATALVQAALAQARAWPGVDFVDLGVSENSPEAHRLYLRFGFQPWGREPETTEYDGQRFDEIFMCLRLS